MVQNGQKNIASKIRKQRLVEPVSDEVDLEELIMDSPIIRVYQHGTGAKKKKSLNSRG